MRPIVVKRRTSSFYISCTPSSIMDSSSKVHDGGCRRCLFIVFLILVVVAGSASTTVRCGSGLMLFNEHDPMHRHWSNLDQFVSG